MGRHNVAHCASGGASIEDDQKAPIGATQGSHAHEFSSPLGFAARWFSAAQILLQIGHSQGKRVGHDAELGWQAAGWLSVHLNEHM